MSSQWCIAASQQFKSCESIENWCCHTFFHLRRLDQKAIKMDHIWLKICVWRKIGMCQCSGRLLYIIPMMYYSLITIFIMWIRWELTLSHLFPIEETSWQLTRLSKWIIFGWKYACGGKLECASALAGCYMSSQWCIAASQQFLSCESFENWRCHTFFSIEETTWECQQGKVLFVLDGTNIKIP